MRATLLAHSVRIRPGVATTLDIEVTNTSDVIDGITAEVFGMDRSWAPLVQPVVTLFPDTSDTLSIRFMLPATCPAGESMITVRVFSTIDESRAEEHPVWITVEPVEAATLEIRPSLVEGGRRAAMQVVVTNTGNVATEFNITAIEPTRALECHVQPALVVVAPGTAHAVTLRVEGRRPFIGQALPRSIDVTATSANLELPASARFLQKPVIPRGVITVAILAAIIALWATIFLLVVHFVRRNAAPAKAVPATWVTGTRDVKIADVAATVSGKVTAASTNEGLARVTVEALRETKKPADSLGGTTSYETAASAATADDGTYTLAALLPGRYKIRFSAEGFDSVWFAGAGVPGVSAEPAAAAGGAAAGGQPACSALSDGSTAGGAGTPGSGPAGGAPDAGGQPSSSIPPVLLTTGQGGSGQGDALVLTLQPLDVRSGVNAVIAGRSGQLVGQVAAPQGAPAAPATVKVELVPANATQPAQPPVQTSTAGPFTICGLTTPATYEVTVQRPGFDPQVTRVDLNGGQSGVLDTASLAAADGTISGQVVDGNGHGLGNVKVVLHSGPIERTVVTPTIGTVGAYTIDRLPTPGTYVLTYTLDGYTSATVALELPGGGSSPNVNPVLFTGAGQIAGTARDEAGNPLGGVKVVVAKGAVHAETATLTSGGGPTGAGSYAVSGLSTDGTYTVTFTLDGYRSETREVALTTGGGTPPTVDVVLRRASSTLSGVVRVQGATRANPSVGLSVELSNGTDQRVAVTTSDPAGFYNFAGVPAGVYTLRVSGAGVTQHVVQITMVEGVDANRDITVAAG